MPRLAIPPGFEEGDRVWDADDYLPWRARSARASGPGGRRSTPDCLRRSTFPSRGGWTGSLPAHFPEPGNLVRVDGELQILVGDVADRQRIERQRVGALRDEGERLGVSRLAHVWVEGTVAT